MLEAQRTKRARQVFVIRLITSVSNSINQKPSASSLLNIKRDIIGTKIISILTHATISNH